MFCCNVGSAGQDGVEFNKKYDKMMSSGNLMFAKWEKMLSLSPKLLHFLADKAYEHLPKGQIGMQ